MVPLERKNIRCSAAKEILPHNNSEHCHLSQKTVQQQMQHLQVVCGDYFHQKSGT
jgi:hypothetical protein